MKRGKISKKISIYLLLFLVYAFILVLLYAPTNTFSQHYEQDIGFASFFSCSTLDCPSFLISLINSSDQVHCAFYDLKDSSITHTLEFHKNAQVVLFDKNAPSFLPNNFFKVKSSGLLHHKFCVFDEQKVLTGSWNPTTRGSYFNDNYIILIDSSLLAKQYLHEYTNLISRTHPQKNTYSAHKHILLSQIKMDSYFCPKDDCEDKILYELNQANTSISILAFTFTSIPLRLALENALTRNVSVQIVFEKTRISKYSAIHALAPLGAELFLDGNPYTMHEKLIIIDNRTIIAGSYNPTKNANLKNDENILIIKNDVTLQTAAINEFNRIKASGSSYLDS